MKTDVALRRRYITLMLSLSYISNFQRTPRTQCPKSIGLNELLELTGKHGTRIVFYNYFCNHKNVEFVDRIRIEKWIRSYLRDFRSVNSDSSD